MRPVPGSTEASAILMLEESLIGTVEVTASKAAF